MKTIDAAIAIHDEETERETRMDCVGRLTAAVRAAGEAAYQAAKRGTGVPGDTTPLAWGWRSRDAAPYGDVVSDATLEAFLDRR